MTWQDDIASALRYFRAHKLRAGLAVLGIAGSVASVVVLMAIADAMRRDKAAYFEEAGSRIAQVVLLNARGMELERERPYKYVDREFGCPYDGITDYIPIKSWREIEQLKAQCPNTIQAISPIINKTDSPPKMACDRMKGDFRIYGVTEDFFNCFAPQPIAGRVFTRAELENNERVIVASHQLNHEYLSQMAGDYSNLEAMYGKGYEPTALPMTLVDEEKTLYLNGIGYQVIGLLPPNRPALEPFFRYNWCGLVPYDQSRALADKQGTNRFIFYPKTTAAAAFADMEPILRNMYPEATPLLRSAEAWADQERRSLGVATAGFLVIGAATLAVAIIGIMNTMLVSVRERRLEIGVRRAMGASAQDIRRQLMVETVFVCVIGIALGIVLAVGLTVFTEYAQRTLIIPALMKFKAYWGTSGAGGKTMDPRGWRIDYGLVALASLGTALVTLGAALTASLLPAREAARLHAVECLRRHWAIPATARRSRWARMPWLRPILDDPERTWLAVSTLMVGVALIVVLTAVGEYNRLASNTWLRAVSSDTLDFHVWEGMTMPFEKYPLFDQAFINEVKKCSHVKEVFYTFSFTRAFYLSGGRFTLRSPTVTADPDFIERHRLWGVDAPSAGLLTFFQNLEMLEGEDLTAEDIAAARPVCVLDEYTAKTMYPNGKALGQPFAVDGQTFTVKGIIREPTRYGEEPWGGAYIPLPFARTVMNNESTQGLSARVSDANLARDEIADLYETRYGVKLERSKQFTMIGEAQALKRREAWFNAALLVSLAAGAMFVGGIGMMNIMLISMTARTREIGTLRALGASRSAIVGQFLFESGVLSALGGLAGIAMGIVLTAYGLPILYLLWDQDQAWPTQLSLHWAGVALAFALLVGVGATLAPAVKASLMAPVEALRDG